MRYAVAICILCALTTTAQADSGDTTMSFTLENDTLRYTIGSDGRSLRFEDRSTGQDYCRTAPFAWIWKADTRHDATSASYTDGRITVAFGDTGISAVIGVTTHKRHLVFEVLAVSDETIDAFVFADINLTLKGTLDEPFAACALSLDLQTNVMRIPGPTNVLQAICYPRFGFAGAEAAIIGCPTEQLRYAMQEAVDAAPELPHSPLGGPRALDEHANRGSYLFNFGDLTVDTADKWIALASNLGITQIDFHGGRSFRFGDCRPNPDMYPDGVAGFKAVIDKLHDAGIKAGLHTYAHFIDKSTAWVTPVPDPRLAKDAEFTLAESVDADDAEVRVEESTEDMSATIGFFVRNSVTIQIDDELIIYSAVDKDAPYGFTGCQRGAYGTAVAPHAAGAKVYHLKECFGLFAPDGDSTLLEEVAAKSAEFYNACGFDMMYLDALDGEDVLGGAAWSWHYGSKFVFELFKRLERPPIMEMSTFHHHLWYVRSRMGAWDHPGRSHKLFIDLHAAANDTCKAMFLPAHLGWWRIMADDDTRTEPTFSDDIEYLCCKCVGTECGLSPQGFTPESFAESYNLRRLGNIIKRYETLRMAGKFTDQQKEMLAQPGAEFTLVGERDGKPVLRRISCAKHKAEGDAEWTVDNEFDAQPARLRIYALWSAGSYDDPGNVTLVDFKDTGVFTDTDAAPGIEAKITPSTDRVKSGEASGLLTAYRAGQEDDGGRSDDYSPLEHGIRETQGGDPSWAKNGVVFSPVRDLTNYRALGVWVYGDGRGEVINFQLRSPEHVSLGIGDHYVVVDFTGWRYFEFIEPEGERIDDYSWPYLGRIYSLYRELVQVDRVESLSIWCNNLPADEPIECYISPVKAMPILRSKLVNPSVEINGKLSLIHI